MGNWSENIVIEKYKSMGYDVISIGKPDLILLKDGEIEFVEVKTGKDKLQENQRAALDLLTSHGFRARMERVKTPRISKRPIWKREQIEIVEQYNRDELEPHQIWNLIARSQLTPDLEDFTGLLVSFFNERNNELDRLEALEQANTC